MRAIVFKCALFSTEADRRRSEAVMRILLEALVEVNMDWLQRHPETPRLYDAGVHYQREEDTEEWKAIPEIWTDREGDCEDLGCWKVAEDRTSMLRLWEKQQGRTGMYWRAAYKAMRDSGIHFPRPHLSWKTRDGIYLYHIRERWHDGRIDDPSRILGMGKEEE